MAKSAAERAAAHRYRQRNCLNMLRGEVSDRVVEALVATGLLDAANSEDEHAVGAAAAKVLEPWAATIEAGTQKVSRRDGLWAAKRGMVG